MFIKRMKYEALFRQQCFDQKEAERLRNENIRLENEISRLQHKLEVLNRRSDILQTALGNAAHLLSKLNQKRGPKGRFVKKQAL